LEKLKKKILKRRLFLAAIIGILAFQIFALNLFAHLPEEGVAWYNGPNKHWSYGMEKSIEQYKFEYIDGTYSNYGAHDWMADSAIRLLIDNPNYRDEVKWLFSEESFQVTIEGVQEQYNPLPIKDFDSYGSKETGGGFRLWFYKDIVNKGKLTKSQWIMARRWGYFLSATAVPDNDDRRSLNQRSSPIPAERAKTRQSKWMVSGAHGADFKKTSNGKDWEYYISGDKGPDTMALQAASDAIWYLNYKEGDKKIPKYEAAAFCLGGMVHYISDACVAGHVTHSSKNVDIDHLEQWSSDSDKGWEGFVASELIFDQNYGVSKTPPYYGGGNGGPKWGNGAYEANPFTTPSGVNIKSTMSPDECARTGGYYAFTGYDKDGNPGDGSLGPNASANLACLLNENYAYLHDNDKDNPLFWNDGWTDFYNDEAKPNSKIRAFEMAEWAAYLSACAIRWVMGFFDPPADTFADRFDEGHIAPGGRGQSLVSIDKIKAWIDSKEGVEESLSTWLKNSAYSSALSSNMASNVANAMLVTPIVALVSLAYLYPRRNEIEIEA
jgi:hypothetical protein